MILLLDTSSALCRLLLIDDGNHMHEYTWQSDRQLARGLLGFIQEKLVENEAAIGSLSGLGVFQGPGSFTGLRIGLTVLNTMADALSIPIVAGVGNDWQKQVIEKLRSGEDQKIVLPFYGREANISQPRK